MSLRWISVASSIFLLCFSCASSSPQRDHSPERNQLALIVRKVIDTTRTVPGSNLYMAELVNNSTQNLRLESVRMPGGYVGSGQYFPCSLDKWDLPTKRWTALRNASLSEYGPKPQLETVQLSPGESKEVCRMMLPAQAGSSGDCVRFRFRAGWEIRDNTSIHSVSFLIDGRTEIVNASCGPKR
jgi:hypothetical protein